ncbi:phosphoserine phosphatase SerB [Sphingorhabdus pulchriflava]|uniref:Phosphoserine phosphatase n=1 Tax=Sphingorhabdus pulchriflava TaxID=2292257 RepID=A0A371BHQ0_9SPHN|nr:phosphoserine phosphatase SerB [Sphingorhabdus pulchriflava]RDV07090.1 phosphoserine phosphatase SerB [Sphingorhabdus pulchriflava]
MLSASSTNVVTLIAADHLDAGMLSEAADRLRDAGLEPGEHDWLELGIAADLQFQGQIEAARDALRSVENLMDVCVQPSTNRRKMLLVSDMDSTIITVECIDELADYAGIKAEIAEITERAMQGELDFEGALRGRVALLKGLHRDSIQQCIDERVRLTPGADILLKTMRGWGAHGLLVSGGFTDFVAAVVDMAGFDSMAANRLGISGEYLNGTVDGEIVDAHEKARQLHKARQQLGLPSELVLAAGDGANDILMLEAAIEGGGIGAAFHAKSVLAEKANFAIRHNDLTALLFAQGVRRSEWVMG